MLYNIFTVGGNHKDIVNYYIRNNGWFSRYSYINEQTMKEETAIRWKNERGSIMISFAGRTE